MTRTEILKKGRLGCDRCYEAFAAEMLPVVVSLQHADQHLGKVPRRASVRLRTSVEQARLRRELEQRKRYPSGRQASLERPQGNVEVWLEVDRSGRVLASGIASRAPNMLLNRAALSSLQSISQLKPFPEEAFAGQSSKKFTATFNYQAP